MGLYIHGKYFTLPLFFQDIGERHVGFASDVEDEDDEHFEKTDLKLQRRDTPHYLKNKRVNLSSEPDEAAAAILSQVLAKTKETPKPKENIGFDRVRSCHSLKGHHQCDRIFSDRDIFVYNITMTYHFIDIQFSGVSFNGIIYLCCFIHRTNLT